MEAKPQVEPSHYVTSEYNSQMRFNSYWMQANEILRFSPGSVLEIGTGNGLVAWYLRRMGVDVVTVDIDKRLEPDLVGSVVSIPIKGRDFDSVACFEVLEHIPFDDLPKALSEISRVTRDRAFISLPDSRPCLRMLLQLPRVVSIKRLVTVGRPFRKALEFDGQHHWEIGKGGVTAGLVTETIERSGFAVERACRLFESPYQHFFRLRKEAGLDQT